MLQKTQSSPDWQRMSVFPGRQDSPSISAGTALLTTQLSRYDDRAATNFFQSADSILESHLLSFLEPKTLAQVQGVSKHFRSEAAKDNLWQVATCFTYLAHGSSCFVRGILLMILISTSCKSSTRVVVHSKIIASWRMLPFVTNWSASGGLLVPFFWVGLLCCFSCQRFRGGFSRKNGDM